MMWLEICFSRKQVEFPRNYFKKDGGGILYIKNNML